jgi:hypothetical protein
MDEIADILISIHIVAGACALGAGLVAATNKIASLSHVWHVVTGRIFFWAMLVVFLTAVPVSIISHNIFLLLVALFSFYLALSGWRYAKNRAAKPNLTDWAKSLIMLITAGAMAIYSVELLRNEGENGITLLVFAAIGTFLGINDMRGYRSGGVTGKARIANHLTTMLAASIATITAFVVVNLSFQPAFVLWLAPSIVITPVIIMMNKRVRRA